MAETKKPVSKRISDVSKPNTSAPSATSKAVIVSNRPILQDPMVVKETSADSDSGTKIKAKIQPLTAPVVEAAKPEPATEPAVSDMPSTKEPAKAEITVNDSIAATEASTEAAPTPEKTETPTDEVATAEVDPAKSADPAEATSETTADGTANTDEAGSEPAKTETSPEAAVAAAEAEATKHDEAIQQMVESKQYFLPINSLEKRRTKRVVVLGIALSVLLAVAWVDVALDASLIELGSVKPVTHFFSN
jgi:hypothetical protein